MTKKKKGNNKTTTSLWVIVVLAIVIYVAQMLTQENKPQHQEKYTELENIIIPEGMTNETHTYTGFTVYFNKDTHIPIQYLPIWTECAKDHMEATIGQ